MEELTDFRFYPMQYDIVELEKMLKRLEPACWEIVRTLPQDEQELFEQYFTLQQQRENWIRMNAYNSGIQIGERRAKKGLIP